MGMTAGRWLEEKTSLFMSMISISYTDRNFRLEFSLSPEKAREGQSPSLITAGHSSQPEMKSDGLRGAPELFPAITTTENGIVSGTNGHGNSGAGSLSGCTALSARDAQNVYGTVLARAGVSPVDLFPPNRVHAWCAGCGEGVARGTGYKHHKIGDRKVYCANCQQGRGFPQRDADATSAAQRGRSA
jgi:hypothetical protein